MAKTTRFFHLSTYFICVVILLTAFNAEARPRPRSQAQNPRYAMLIMDAQSGNILEKQNEHKSLPPASLTKLMTLFLTFEAIEQHKLSLNDTLVISANAMRQPPSKLGLRRNDKVTINQAIHILVTRSANDVAMALAETVGGSEKNFTRMMTQRAHSLGMKESYFYNPSGLPNPGQKSSAYDMAILARAIMQYFPHHYHVFKTIRFNYKGQTIETHNNLMRRFKGMDGMKTGYTVASGFNLVASAVRNNRRVIVVVFGGRSAVSRDNHVAELMNRSLAQLNSSPAPTQIANPSAIPGPVATRTTVATNRATATPPRYAPQPQKPVAPAPAPARTIQTRPTASSDRAGWSPDGGHVRPLQAQQQQAAATQPTYNQPGRNWGIQIGAFSSVALSQQALQNARSRLGSTASEGKPVIVPSPAAQGMIYRARIVNLSSQSATRACQILSDCMAFTAR